MYSLVAVQDGVAEKKSGDPTVVAAGGSWS